MKEDENADLINEEVEKLLQKVRDAVRENDQHPTHEEHPELRTL